MSHAEGFVRYLALCYPSSFSPAKDPPLFSDFILDNTHVLLFSFLEFLFLIRLLAPILLSCYTD